MSTRRYSENRTYREEVRDDNGYNIPYGQRSYIPIENTTNIHSSNLNEQRLHERLRNQNTSLQWVNDPVSGAAKLRITVNIDGFNQNEVKTKIDGNKLHIYGERIENANQTSVKKTIEKSYDLPRDIIAHSSQVSFPNPTTMQIDFSSQHSNVIIDGGRVASHLTSTYENNSRPPPTFPQQSSSSEYISTRKIGGTSGTGGSYRHRQSPSPYSSTSYQELFDSTSPSRSNNTFTSTSGYQSKDFGTPVYTYTTTNTYPSVTPSTHENSGRSNENTFTETHRHSHHQPSYPTTGLQSSYESENYRTGIPFSSTNVDSNRFRSNMNSGGYNITSQPSSHNIEVREYSRPIGKGANNETSVFSRGFNSDAFFRSSFQPQIFTDEHGQQRVDMKLDVSNYDPNDIKISVNGNDLIVQAEHNVEQPPSSSSRAYFYKQVTLPNNTDFQTLSSRYHPDGKLSITANLTRE